MPWNHDMYHFLMTKVEDLGSQSKTCLESTFKPSNLKFSFMIGPMSNVVSNLRYEYSFFAALLSTVLDGFK